MLEGDGHGPLGDTRWNMGTQCGGQTQMPTEAMQTASPRESDSVQESDASVVVYAVSP